MLSTRRGGLDEGQQDAGVLVGLSAHSRLTSGAKGWPDGACVPSVNLCTPAVHEHDVPVLSQRKVCDRQTDKPVGELARVLLSFKRPTRPHRTATVPIIRSFHLRLGLCQLLLLRQLLSECAHVKTCCPLTYA